MVPLFCLSTLQQSHKTAKQMSGLTRHHYILLHKLVLVLIFLFQQRGILSLLTVKTIWIHNSPPLQCHSMGRILHFPVFVLQHLVVVVLPPLLLRLVILIIEMLYLCTILCETSSKQNQYPWLLMVHLIIYWVLLEILYL